MNLMLVEKLPLIDSGQAQVPALQLGPPDLLRRLHAQWLIQPERQHGFDRHFDSTLGQDLRERARAGTGSRADRRALATTRDGADNRAHPCATPSKYAGTLVRADARTTFLL